MSATDKIDAELRFAMDRREQDEFDVVVTFRDQPGPLPQFPGLAVYGDMADGRLGRDQILDLAGRDDVLSIGAEPQEKLRPG